MYPSFIVIVHEWTIQQPRCSSAPTQPSTIGQVSDGMGVDTYDEVAQPDDAPGDRAPLSTH